MQLFKGRCIYLKLLRARECAQGMHAYQICICLQELQSNGIEHTKDFKVNGNRDKRYGPGAKRSESPGSGEMTSGCEKAVFRVNIGGLLRFH